MDKDFVWSEGCEQWMREHRVDGWPACYLNFMFKPLHGTTNYILEQMQDSIHREFAAHLI